MDGCHHPHSLLPSCKHFFTVYSFKASQFPTIQLPDDKYSVSTSDCFFFLCSQDLAEAKYKLILLFSKFVGIGARR